MFIIVIITIAVISPFSLIAILEKKKIKPERFVELVWFQFDKSTWRFDMIFKVK